MFESEDFLIDAPAVAEKYQVMTSTFCPICWFSRRMLFGFASEVFVIISSAVADEFSFLTFSFLPIRVILIGFF